MSLNLYILRGGTLPSDIAAHAAGASPNICFAHWRANVLSMAAWWFRQPQHGCLSAVASLNEVPADITAKLSLWWNAGETVADAADMLTHMTAGYMVQKRATSDVVALRACLKARMAQ